MLHSFNFRCIFTCVFSLCCSVLVAQLDDRIDAGLIKADQFYSSGNIANPISLNGNESIDWATGGIGCYIRSIVLDNTSGSEDTELEFVTSKNGVWSEGMVFTNDSELGVGTLNPSGALHVVGQGIIMERNGAPFIRFLDTEGAVGDKTWVIQANAPNNGDLRIRNETDSDDIFIIESDGDVRVNGSIAHSSDARKKKEIRVIDQALEKVLQLSGVSFEWKNRSDQKRQIGFIAQDVERVIPELVETIRRVINQ